MPFGQGGEFTGGGSGGGGGGGGGNGTQTGTGSPLNVVTPNFAGAVYTDQANGNVWVAETTASSSWVLSSATGPQGPAGPPTPAATAHTPGTSVALATGTSTTVLASNAARVQVWITNTSAFEQVTLILSAGTVTPGNGIVLSPGQVFTEQVYTGQIEGTCSNNVSGTGSVALSEV